MALAVFPESINAKVIVAVPAVHLIPKFELAVVCEARGERRVMAIEGLQDDLDFLRLLQDVYQSKGVANARKADR